MTILQEAAQRALDFIRALDRDDNDRDYLRVSQCDELDACRDDLRAALRSEAEQKSSNLKFYILSVTTAYEQGVGKGHQAFKRGKDIENPYSNLSDCAEAWSLGYQEGMVMAKNSQGSKPLTYDQIINAMCEDGCERIQCFYSTGPVQKAAVWSFVGAIEAALSKREKS